MKLDFIPLDRLSVARANMRDGKAAPDVSDLLPTVRSRGILQTLLVRPVAEPDCFEVLAGRRRLHAARLVAEEAGRAEPVPCAILEAGDDAAAIEASLIENLARLDPDEVTQWATFTRLVKEGRGVGDIAATFGIPELAVRRILALGNLLPRIRSLYAAQEIDAATIRHLTMASKSQQRDWLALGDGGGRRPAGQQLKAWLFGGQSIRVAHALFDLADYPGQIVADLFGEDRYFADPQAFWTAQEAAIAARVATYREAGWSDIVIVPASEHFAAWDYEKTPKRKGGRVYVDVRSSGEVVFHEGYLSRAEARRIARGEAAAAGPAAKPPRPELTSTLQAYADHHRHAAVGAALLDAPAVALRLMVAHAIAGSPFWSVRVEPRASRSDAVRESVEASPAVAALAARRRVLAALLELPPEEASLAGGNGNGNGDGYRLVRLFLRLLDLADGEVGRIAALVMSETLAAGSPAVEAVGCRLGVDMAAWWKADEALLAAVRDRELLAAIVAEVAGPLVASANAKEKGGTLRQIVRDHLAGASGRAKVEGWVPRWMRFPPSAYTERGGVATVAAHERCVAAREEAENGATDTEPGADTSRLEVPPARGGDPARDGDGSEAVALVPEEGDAVADISVEEGIAAPQALAA